jgi:polyferredoxin
MLDEQSFIVTYQNWRGEPRGRGRRDSKGMVGSEKLGDCIDCNACVNVCPTGIDIRNGLQLDCIGCGQCADACDAVMTKLERPKGNFLGNKYDFNRQSDLLRRNQTNR